MSFEQDDEELMKMLKDLRGKKPPKHIFQNFEEEVIKKIHQNAPFLGVGWIPVVCVGAAVAVGLAFFILFKWQPAQNAQPVLVSVETPKEAQVIAPALPVSELQKEEATEQVFNRFSDNLLLLQMLGEDQGLVDHARLIESDVEILAQLNPPSGAPV